MAQIKDAKTALQETHQQKPAVNTLKSLLSSESIKRRFEEVLGKKAAGFTSSILSIVNNNNHLKLCDPMSIITSASIAASLDLPINQNLGYAYIVPYSGKAQFQMGWRGFWQLAMRSGLYKTANVREVFEGDIIKHNRFTGEFEFNEGEPKSNKVVGYVAYFKLLNGFEKYYYMTDAELDAHGKKYSKSYNTGNWKTNPKSMKEKTVFKMLLSKYGILSIDMQRAMETDQAVIKEDGTPEYIDNEDAVEADIVPEENKINSKQLALIHAKINEYGIDIEFFKKYLKTEFGFESRKDITQDKMDTILAWIDNNAVGN